MIVKTLALIMAAALTLQERAFRSSTDVVPVPVTVTDREGRPVLDLTRDDFRLFDSGKPREIAQFITGRQPISLALLFDRSASMSGSLPRMLAVAQALVSALDVEDQVSLGTLSRDVTPMTSDKAQVLRQLQPGGPLLRGDVGSPIWRALNRAVESLAQVERRRVALVFTDGGDDEFVFSPFMAAERANVTLYVVGFEDTDLDERFSTGIISSGGSAAMINRKDDPSLLGRQIADALHPYYLLGFVPAVADGKTHKIEIKTTRRDLLVRARKSYAVK